MFEIDGPLAILTFNRPEARNAMTWEMYDALVDACDRVDADAACACSILRGAGGKAFVSGTDIAQFQSFRDREDGDRLRGADRRRARPARARHEADDRAGRRAWPPAAAARSRWPATCASRRRSRVRHPDRAHARQLPVGHQLQPAGRSDRSARAKDLMFTGRFVGAAEAHAIGLVNRVVPADGHRRVVRDLALEIAAQRAADDPRDEGDGPPRLLAQRRLRRVTTRSGRAVLHERRFPRRGHGIFREAPSALDWTLTGAARLPITQSPRFLSIHY